MPAILATLIATVVTYFICGVPFGYLVSRAGGVDVRSVGSGNIGTTNVARSVGAKAAGATLGLDVLKGLLCTLIAKYLFAWIFFAGDTSMLLPSGAFGWMLAWVYLATIVGHIFSCYLGFRGGKGIAVGLGGALGFMAPVGLSALALFICLALPTRYVSVGSLAAAISLPFFAELYYHPSVSFFIPIVMVSVLVCWAHRQNISKLLHGQESRFSIRKKSKNTH